MVESLICSRSSTWKKSIINISTRDTVQWGAINLHEIFIQLRTCQGCSEHKGNKQNYAHNSMRSSGHIVLSAVPLQVLLCVIWLTAKSFSVGYKSACSSSHMALDSWVSYMWKLSNVINSRFFSWLLQIYKNNIFMEKTIIQLIFKMILCL